MRRAASTVLGFFSSAQRHADLDRSLKEVMQPRPAMKDHVAGEFDLGHRPLARTRRARGELNVGVRREVQ